MKLVDQVVQTFRVVKLFRDNTEKINNIDYSPSGDLLLTSSDDDQIVIYDCEKGTSKRTLNSKKYGVDLIHFTHGKNSAIYASTKIDDTIRYLSLHDNKFIRYFPGHTKRVGTLSMSPIDDSFISGSADKTLRLWDLRSPNCQGTMHAGGRPVAAFDPEGLIFAAGINSEHIKLYDLSSYCSPALESLRTIPCELNLHYFSSGGYGNNIYGNWHSQEENMRSRAGRSFFKGPFSTFELNQEKECDWTGLKFSPDGKTILVSTNGSVIRLVDAYTGTPLKTFAGHMNNKGIPLEASFSPDSQFVFSGSTDGHVHVWHAEKGYKVSTLNGDHTGPVQCIQFNPKYMMLASACSHMAFWLPALDQ